MKHIYIILLSTILYAQDSCDFRHDEVQLICNQQILKQNPRTHKFLSNYEKCLSSVQILNILQKLNSNKWSDYQASLAIDLYQQLNKNVQKTPIVNLRGQVNSKIDSMVFNLERDISSELGIKKSNSEKTNNLDQIYLDINVPWRLAQENQDSINFYLRKGDVENFRNYMLRLENSTVEP